MDRRRWEAISNYGVHDVVGNVREWCWNDSDRGGRFVLGGGWSDWKDMGPIDAFDRSPTNGFRCMRNLSVTTEADPRRGTVSFLFRDYRTEKPVSDVVFAAYRHLFSYDRTDLNAEIVEEEDERDWVRQTVSFDTAYGEERMTAYLYLPQSVKPPYQTVVFYPGAYAFMQRSFDARPQSWRELWDFIIRSGRVLMYPIYTGSFERGDGLGHVVDESNAHKEWVIHNVQDLMRSIDYLETRADTDDRVAYYGFSVGALKGPTMMALEDRIKAGVLYGGGFLFERALPMGRSDQFLSARDRTGIDVEWPV